MGGHSLESKDYWLDNSQDINPREWGLQELRSQRRSFVPAGNTISALMLISFCQVKTQLISHLYVFK